MLVLDGETSQFVFELRYPLLDDFIRNRSIVVALQEEAADVDIAIAFPI